MASNVLEIDLSGLRLRHFEVKSHQVKDALGHAVMEILYPESQDAVPHVSGDLAASWYMAKSRGGNNTIVVGYRSVYARWIHEHLHFHHPHGGGAKYLERPMRTTGNEVMVAAALELIK